MPSRYPKFERKINTLHTTKQNQMVSPSYGIVTAYNATTNTATVIATLKGAESNGKTYVDVPCPVTIGVQQIGPTQGQPCWLGFKDNKDTQPVIITFFNPKYNTISAPSNNAAKINTPTFTFRM